MPVTVSKGEWRWALVWAAIIVGLASLPFLLAWQLAPDGTSSTGLLINHYDGASYYAKMQQGARGDWLFHLAFTPEPHEGSFVFVFYLALGHLAGALGLSIPLTFHLARAAAGLFLLLVAYRFIAHFFARVRSRRLAYLLLGLSAGFGWLVGPLGFTTADLWVARVFVRSLDQDRPMKEVLEGLETAAPFIRKELGKLLHIRRLPELRFVHDDTLDSAQRIEEVLKEVLPEKGDTDSDPGDSQR